MKKIFTLICALVAFASVSSAATVDDLAPLKHSYVLVCDELGARPGKGVLFGDDHFLDVTGGSTATNKGQVDLSVVNEADDNHVTQAIVDKYGADYAGPHYNFLRLKNAQDVIAMKLTAGSKIIIFEQGNNKTGKDARIPKIAKSADLSDALNPAPDADHPTTDAGFRWEYTVDDDGLFYIGSYNGDMFVSYIIIEAQEAEGTPQVKMGAQTYEEGLWFKEVTVTPGLAYGLPTEVYYTTDGTEPTADSQKYTAPIKCYKEMTLKFQAFMSGMAVPDANNEVSVSFSFDAPSIDADGANVTITSAYEGAKNYYTLNGGEAQEGSNFTLTESATVAAYSKIVNGTFATFTTKTTTKDVYVLNPIKSKKVIEVIAGDVVLDEEATASSTTGEVYRIDNGEISADKADFFVKNLTLKAITDEQYQVPAGNARYIQMSNTNITFQVAEGDSVTVKVICSKNSCKNIDAEDAEDGSMVNDRKCMVNVSGTNYFHTETVTLKDSEGNDSIATVEASDMKLYENANIIEFGLTEGTYTFQKYSGTGNIMISSIEITPAAAASEEPAEPGKLIAEKDWTTETAYPYFNMGVPEGATYDVQDGALVVTNTVKQADIWGLQLFALDWFNVTQGNDYVVRIYATIPVDGQVQVNMGTWNGADQHVYDVTASQTTKAYDFTFDNYQGATATGNDAHVLWQQGWLVGTVKISKVQLFEKESSGIKSTVAEKAFNGAVYNLAGQKVDANFKGVVIKNGKKMLQK